MGMVRWVGGGEGGGGSGGGVGGNGGTCRRECVGGSRFWCRKGMSGVTVWRMDVEVLAKVYYKGTCRRKKGVVELLLHALLWLHLPLLHQGSPSNRTLPP